MVLIFVGWNSKALSGASPSGSWITGCSRELSGRQIHPSIHPSRCNCILYTSSFQILHHHSRFYIIIPDSTSSFQFLHHRARFYIIIQNNCQLKIYKNATKLKIFHYPAWAKVLCSACLLLVWWLSLIPMHPVGCNHGPMCHNLPGRRQNQEHWETS